MARAFNLKVFETVIMGTSAQYTDPSFNDRLAVGDQLAIHAVVDQVTGTSPTITCAVEQSGDQRNWAAKNGTAEINAVSLSTTATTSTVGYETGANPSSGFVRLRVQLGGTGSVGARIQIYVCGRTH